MSLTLRLAMLIAAACCFSVPAIAIDFQCPQTITSVQQLAEPVSGWTEFSRDPWGTAGNPHTEKLLNKSGFSRIEIYDGSPKEIADLIPDNERDTWSFNAPAPDDRPLFMSCVYQDTYVRLVKQLPANVIKCRASSKGKLSCDQARP